MTKFMKITEKMVSWLKEKSYRISGSFGKLKNLIGKELNLFFFIFIIEKSSILAE